MKIQTLKQLAVVSAFAALACVMPVSMFGEIVLNGDIGDGTSPVYSGVGATNTPGTFWNSLTPNIGPNTSLKLSDGITSTPITFDVGANAGVDVGTGATPAEALLRDYAFTSAATTLPVPNNSWSFNNVPTFPVGHTFDLYLYSQNGHFKSSISGFTIGGTTYVAANNNTVSTFVLGTNYVLFTGLTPVGGVISGTFNNIANNAAFNGFQLVEVPEPATMSLLVVGGMFLRRRRTQQK